MKVWLSVVSVLCFTICVHSRSILQPGHTQVNDYEKGPVLAEEDDDEDMCLPEKKILVVYYNFQNLKKKFGLQVEDKSGYANNGEMMRGTEIVLHSDPDFTCGQCVRLWQNDIKLNGITLSPKPETAITIAAWIRMDETTGVQSIFDTIGLSHTRGQYHFEVVNKDLRWFHRNGEAVVVFETRAIGLIKKDAWIHVAGTYNSKTAKAGVFVNGKLVNFTMGNCDLCDTCTGCNVCGLSTDWGSWVGIGDHQKNRPFHGSLDEFRIYNHALPEETINKLYQACLGPMKREELKEEENKKREKQKLNTEKIKNLKMEELQRGINVTLNSANTISGGQIKESDQQEASSEETNVSKKTHDAESKNEEVKNSLKKSDEKAKENEKAKESSNKLSESKVSKEIQPKNNESSVDRGLTPNPNKDDKKAAEKDSERNEIDEKSSEKTNTAEKDLEEATQHEINKEVVDNIAEKVKLEKDMETEPLRRSAEEHEVDKTADKGSTVSMRTVEIGMDEESEKDGRKDKLGEKTKELDGGNKQIEKTEEKIEDSEKELSKLSELSKEKEMEIEENSDEKSHPYEETRQPKKVEERKSHNESNINRDISDHAAVEEEKASDSEHKNADSSNKIQINGDKKSNSSFYEDIEKSPMHIENKKLGSKNSVQTKMASDEGTKDSDSRDQIDKNDDNGNYRHNKDTNEVTRDVQNDLGKDQREISEEHTIKEEERIITEEENKSAENGNNQRVKIRASDDEGTEKVDEIEKNKAVDQNQKTRDGSDMEIEGTGQFLVKKEKIFEPNTSLKKKKELDDTYQSKSKKAFLFDHEGTDKTNKEEDVRANQERALKG